MGMPGKLTVASPKNQLLWSARCPGANERAFALHAREHLLPGIVARVLERDTQRLIEIDCLVEEVNRTLGLALLQSLLPEPGAERQDLECAEIAPTARD